MSISKSKKTIIYVVVGILAVLAGLWFFVPAFREFVISLKEKVFKKKVSLGSAYKV
jgi:uncharacterized membrane protein YuzA (DUF378 family)